MTTKRRKTRQRPFKRYSPVEQEQILTRFEAASGDGRSTAEVIRGLGASLASIQRWQRTRRLVPIQPPPTHAQRLGIDDAIARLADAGNNDRHTFLEALFKFIAWLRWPHAPGDHPSAITVCMVAYLSHGRSTETLDELPADDLALMLRHIRIDVIRRVCTDKMYSLPIFALWDINGQPYKETDYLAEIVHFLLAYQPSSGDKRAHASLNKAYYASQNNIFRYHWRLSQTTFRSYWSDHGITAPFLYVERYHSALYLSLDPGQPDFADSIRDIIKDRGAFRIYLTQCRAAVELLKKRLDSRALKNLHFSNFPIDLHAVAFEPPALPTITDDVMANFGRSDKRAKSAT